jgi:NAD(P)-dependent dehydrogenase (short-subunit alcohol dehydrogenase family)
MEIAGKVFIVTGGASGLGEGSVRMFVREGGKVIIADVQADKGEALAKELGAGNAAFVRCDVTQEADAKAVVARAQSIGKLMGLVNCAGVGRPRRRSARTARIRSICSPRPSPST